MATNKTGLSRELIIHPGETLKEVLDERKITQKQLATQTGFTPQHISRVINGTTNISADFAIKLEHVLAVPASFWVHLQANYDLELAQYEEGLSIAHQEMGMHHKISESQIAG